MDAAPRGGTARRQQRRWRSFREHLTRTCPVIRTEVHECTTNECCSPAVSGVAVTIGGSTHGWYLCEQHVAELHDEAERRHVEDEVVEWPLVPIHVPEQRQPGDPS